MRIVSIYRRTFLDNTVLGIKVTYEDNTTEWLTEEEYNAIKQSSYREEEESAGNEILH